MQRVRIGLTGLACVFLLVILAASIFGMAGGDRLSRAPDQTPGNAAAKAETPKEPLAELGVAPGNAPDSQPTTNSVQPVPAPAS